MNWTSGARAARCSRRNSCTARSTFVSYTHLDVYKRQLREQCDVCVCIYHGGFEEELETGRVLSDSGENLACKIARELDFDLLLTGHQHMAVEGVNLSGTCLLYTSRCV